MINDNLLKGFEKRIDEADTVLMYYEKQEKPKNAIRKIHSVIPPYCGCLYCELAKKEGAFTYCPVKKKHYASDGIKKCPIFKMKEMVLT